MKKLILTPILTIVMATPVLAGNLTSPLYSSITIADNSTQSINIITVAEESSMLTGDSKPNQNLLPNQSAQVESVGDTWSPPSIQSTISTLDGSSICVAYREMGAAIRVTPTGSGTLKCTVNGGTVNVG